MGTRIAVDTGGTFTDFVVADPINGVSIFKTPSTPHAPEQAIITGIEQLAGVRSQSVPELLENVELFIHGTTIGTNTVIERNGPRVGVLHTEGFRDILELRDGHKEDRYNLHLPPPEPLVPRHLRLAVGERVTYSGAEHRPLDEASVRSAVRIFRRERIESIAVCLLWSMVNPKHERRVGEILREELPSAYIALSSEILPALREYHRTCATVLSAYVGPVIGAYLRRVAFYLRDNGYRYEMLIMQVTGGSSTVPEIEQRPVLAIGSGPAAGPAAGVRVGAEEGDANLMIVDMGGTSFEVSVVTDGSPTLTRDARVAEMPIGVAAVDIHSIGAGGGSIAWVDSGGMLRVGPHSAGATPGPACYGHGGDEPTVTDANLVLGYLNPDYFLGGRMALDRERAEFAVAQIAGQLGMGVVETAAAIYRVVNMNMCGAMRAVTVMRGVDPREYVVVVGGGAGGVHAAEIARELGVRSAICPVVAGGLCAFGMLASDVKHSYLTTAPMNTATIDPAEVDAIYSELEGRAVADLTSQGFARDQIALDRYADAKYPYQMHELIVSVGPGRVTASGVNAIAATFHTVHRRLYTYSLPELSVDVTGWRLTATGRMPALAQDAVRRRAVSPTLAGPRKPDRHIYLAEQLGVASTPIYDGGLLEPGMVVEGPAVAEFATTTLVMFAGDSLTVSESGDLRISLRQAAVDTIEPPQSAGRSA